jgi:hypothetical protein
MRSSFGEFELIGLQVTRTWYAKDVETISL